MCRCMGMRDRTHTFDMEECLEMDRGEDLWICTTAQIETKREESVGI